MAAVLLLASAHAAEARQIQPPSGQGSQSQASVSTEPVPQAARPYRGLFGAGSAAAPGGHVLDLTTNIYEEYGTNTDGEIPGATVTGAGWFFGLRSRLSFERAGRSARVALRGEGAFRYYQETGETTAPRFRGEFIVDGATGSRKQNPLRFVASADYEPYYILSIFPTSVLPTGDVAILPTSRDDLLFRRTRYIFSQSFDYQRQVSRRTYINLYEETRTTRADTAGLDVTDFRIAGRWGYHLSQHGSLRLGYMYRSGRYGLDATQPIVAHDADVSYDYRKPLSRSRQTSVGFTTGVSRVTAGQYEQWLTIARANLRHELGAGWFVQAYFARDFQLVEGFADPFFVNTASGSLGGFLGHRLEVFGSGGYSWGEVGFGSDQYTSYQGSARMRLALARYVAIDAEGLINQFTADNIVPATGAVPGRISRWSVRANLALWLPLSRQSKGRRP